MALQRDACESVKVEIGAAIERTIPPPDQIEADVSRLGYREDLGRRHARKEEGDVRERRHVIAAEAAGVAAGDRRGPQRRKGPAPRR